MKNGLEGRVNSRNLSLPITTHTESDGMASHNVYSDQLLTLQRGFALWEPDPAGEYEHVEVGDVGYLMWGSFQRLFNVFLPAEHPSQNRGVPECFEPLVLPESRRVKSRILPAGKYMSRSVRHVELSAGASRCVKFFIGHNSFELTLN